MITYLKKILPATLFLVIYTFSSTHAREWETIDQLRIKIPSALEEVSRALVQASRNISIATSADEIAEIINSANRAFNEIEIKRATEAINIDKLPEGDQSLILQELKIIYQQWQQLVFQLTLQAARMPSCSLGVIKFKDIHVMLDRLRSYFNTTFLNTFLTHGQTLPTAYFKGIDTEFKQLDSLVDSIRSTPPSSPIEHHRMSSPRRLPPLVRAEEHRVERTFGPVGLPQRELLAPLERDTDTSRTHRRVTFQEAPEPAEASARPVEQDKTFSLFQTRIIIDDKGSIDTTFKNLLLSLWQQDGFYQLFKNYILSQNKDNTPLVANAQRARNFTELLSAIKNTEEDSITTYDIIEYIALQRTSKNSIIQHAASILFPFYEEWTRLKRLHQRVDLTKHEAQKLLFDSQQLFESLGKRGKIILHLIQFTQRVKRLHDAGYSLRTLSGEIRDLKTRGANAHEINKILEVKCEEIEAGPADA